MNYNRTFLYLDIEPLSLNDNYTPTLKRDGIVLIDTLSDFSNEEYIELMSTLGNPIEESEQVENQYIEDRYILNIKSDVTENITMENEPFSVHGLRMHVEKAFGEQSKQPNYLALLCITAPKEDNGGQTIVRDIASLISQFTSEELEAMKVLYPMTIQNHDIVSKNPIYSLDRLRELYYLSYRDLGHYGKDWMFKDTDINSKLIKEIVSKLEKYLYSSDYIKALTWKTGYLYVFDNKKYFHARTEQKKASERHLKRIRVV